MLKVVPLLLLVLGIAGFVFATGQSATAQDPPRPNRVFVPALASDRVQFPEPPPAPTPTPEPPVYDGAVQSIYLASGGISANAVVEQRHTEIKQGRETFQDPTHPSRIAWYSAFGRPGFRGANTIFAAHVDYVGYGRGPFWYLSSADIGDLLYVTMDNGQVYAYSVKTVETIPVSSIDMNVVVYPGLASDRERITLISCGGTFVPGPGGYGGEYLSRLLLTAERVIE